ncbi:very short patch repair endonuclease [Aestuariimicrobium sp. T2.26MG-19.2B]|uniref:very short patch repair endonuclease n=1 Tax=Aestuariimicrobium sp. T2.26MG-19.2B TaxID=3040679 RepID=UPI00253FFA78|nr:very short patch repair endonuclease [Aestuariimicrobium sp. T2.26MG-19.2B]
MRRRMSSQKRAGTSPELALRRELHRLGLRFRVGHPVPGRPQRTIDIAFTRKRVAVFVDGCFWHGCPLHCVPPKANPDWWQAKLAANSARDRETTDLLELAGWTVVRCWEHEPLMEMVGRVTANLGP